MVDYNKFKKLKANRDKVKEKQKQNKIVVNNYEQLVYKYKMNEILRNINDRKSNSNLY